MSIHKELPSISSQTLSSQLTPLKRLYVRILTILTYAWKQIRRIGFILIRTKSDLPVESSSLKPAKTGYKSEQEKWKRLSKAAITLNRGFHWNPLLRYPRNSLCFCGSGIKSKKCCLPKIPMAIPMKEYESKRQIVLHAVRSIM